ncbi:RNA polymerase factor sigma-54 [Alloyangia pacifica]|uniref:RNA polymerase sigma-54 factor n=1 Tax=Alloyangia pacifica TaxID=311180 RepID=A0A1I6QUJ7_9RHOB|nr:RNA polymerase factor sigma-54 [Alloyangia pacifica]SDF99589.1 RNA polymerase, sigma 54 subunit, RpoN/SigL [Alloyangia pacifica]SFS56042.1 RNA polymerase, sigma 54 subunit, RpoN/SigL [Alloyangia pacifica]
MELVQTISQRQTMQMGGQMLQSLTILGMASQDLSEHLREKSESNPFVTYRPPSAFAARGGDEFDAVAAVAADRPSLMAHVVGQIELAFPAPADRMIALYFAEALEPTGWLGQPVESIALLAGCPPGKAEQVLGVLQGFEPAGLFARSLSDCLMIQAREADLLTWELETLIANLELLAEGRTKELADLCDCEPRDIPEIVAQIRGLNPKPGLAFEHTPAPVFPPDLVATRGTDGWTVELNRATTPTIKVQEERLPDGKIDAEARKQRRRALSEARALALALERRGDTLLRTAAVLVARQGQFLDRGSAYLTPLTLEDVAGELGVHPSTVSRAVSGRMIQTPGRALPLRAFFSRPVSGTGGEAVSRDSAMDFVQRVVGAENPREPLSDDAIVSLAQSAGLRIARRTVAKYRSVLGLGSSYERRRRAMDA